ncbi:MAG TPA: YdeI/OmpD-associated family protein [Gemmatimonadaceae bacterium]|nr:YdeI/OmpD-associated family protein [Gemmatimonadaceae bacterium]
MAAATPTFFATPADFRAWLERHHDTGRELLVGFYKKGAGKPSITWPESVDEALCFGWIDGVRRSIDDESYSIRFTPRKPRSNWSAVNVARVAALTKAGRMHPAGLAAFEARAPERTGIYAYEQRTTAELSPADEKRFRANKKAWAFFESQPPGYRHLALWWVVTAKKEETRQKRLATLIDDSANGRRLHGLAQPGERPKKA